MNKLILGNKDDLKNIFITEDTYLQLELENSNNDIHIEVAKGICLKVFQLSKKTSNKVEYVLNENSSVIVNNFGIDNQDKIDIYLNNLSNINYNLNLINHNGNYIEQNINHNGNHVISKITNHCVNYSNDSFRFLINSNIPTNSYECDCDQNNKIINMSSGKNIISPNLIVDNNLVDAKHSAYIGNFDDDVYFYLQSRGLTKEKIDKLLIEGFLIGYTDIDNKEKQRVLDFFNFNN